MPLAVTATGQPLTHQVVGRQLKPDPATERKTKDVICGESAESSYVLHERNHLDGIRAHAAGDYGVKTRRRSGAVGDKRRGELEWIGLLQFNETKRGS